MRDKKMRESLVKEKSEEDFEKNLTYITAGVLTLSLTFLDKIVPIKESSYIYLIIVSWSILTLTLLSDLVSHQYASYIMDKMIEDIDNNDEDLQSNWKRRTNKIRCWNVINIWNCIFRYIRFYKYSYNG